MAHFAQVNDENVVVQVIVISNDDAPDPYPESEPIGQEFISSLRLAGQWRQTSYHGTFRKNYAGIGFTYDADRDAFIPPKPQEGEWALDEDTCLWVEVES
jgi:hypothetical protein